MSTFVAKDGTQIYFKDWGSGKPVLFSHGWPLDADMWEYQMEYLSSRGFRTLAFDRRGFGRSDQPWTGNDYDTFADDIAQLIEHLDLKDVTWWASPWAAATSRATSPATAAHGLPAWCCWVR